MSPDPRSSDRGARFLVVAACFIIVVAGLRAAAAIVVPFLLAVFLAMICVPLLEWLRTRRVPVSLAVFLTVAALFLVLAAVAALVAQSVTGFTAALPRYQQRLGQFVLSVSGWLAAIGVPVPQAASLDLLNPAAVLNLVGGLLSALTALLSNAVLVLLTVVFILFEAAGFGAKLRAAFGGQARTGERFAAVTSQIQQYLLIKTGISLATGVLAAAVVALLGVDFPWLWGLTAFVFNFIPNLGSILAAVPPILLGLLQYGTGRAVGVAAGYLAINFALGNIVEPMLLGRRLGLSTLVVFLSLVFWGWVLGPIGMLLSVPLTMVVKIALENTADLRWMAVMLDPNPGGIVPMEPRKP